MAVGQWRLMIHRLRTFAQVMSSVVLPNRARHRCGSETFAGLKQEIIRSERPVRIGDQNGHVILVNLDRDLAPIAFHI